MNATVSIEIEIPQELYDAYQKFVETHPNWDTSRVGSAALSLFLLQNGECDRRASRVYLDSLFEHAV